MDVGGGGSGGRQTTTTRESERSDQADTHGAAITVYLLRRRTTVTSDDSLSRERDERAPSLESLCRSRAPHVLRDDVEAEEGCAFRVRLCVDKQWKKIVLQRRATRCERHN